jgi:hypothetical protein
MLTSLRGVMTAPTATLISGRPLIAHENRKRDAVTISARIFEFLKVVLAHEAQQFLYLTQFWVRGRRTSTRLLRLFPFHAFSNLNEIPLDAGQDFTSTGAYCHVVFDPDAPNTFEVHARFYRNHISWFESSCLVSRYSGLFMYFQSQTMTCTVHEPRFQPVLLQDVSHGGIHIPAGNASLHRRYPGFLCFLYCPVPAPNSLRRPSHVDRSRHIAAIVAEYNTQV